MIEYFRLHNAIIRDSIFTMFYVRLLYYNEKITNKMMVKGTVCKILNSTERFKRRRVFVITALLSLIKSI